MFNFTELYCEVMCVLVDKSLSALQKIALTNPHEEALTKLSMNASGTLIATVSFHGTLVRVSHIPSGYLASEFRRSLTQSVLLPYQLWESDQSMFFRETGDFSCVPATKVPFTSSDRV